MHEVVPVQEWHIEELSSTMQKEDKDSCWALAHLSPEQGIRLSLKNAVESYTWLADGKVGLIFGVNKHSLLSHKAHPWLLASDLVQEHPRVFLRGCKEWINSAVTKYEWLDNYVDARHIRSIRWLQWMGFTIYPAEPIGIEKMLFHRNEIRYGS